MDGEAWIADRAAAGTPEAMARMTLTTFQAARQGRFAGVDSLLAELLGREPRSRPARRPERRLKEEARLLIWLCS